MCDLRQAAHLLILHSHPELCDLTQVAWNAVCFHLELCGTWVSCLNFSVILLKLCDIRQVAWSLCASTFELCDLRQVAWPICLPLELCDLRQVTYVFFLLPYLSCMILGKVPNHSVLPPLSCVVLDKLSLTYLLFHFLSCANLSLGKLPVLCAPLVSCVI